MFFGMLMVSLAPKAIGLMDVALTPGGAARFGGGWRLAAGAVAELVLSVLMAPVVAFQATLFLVGLAFGYRVPWSGQNRDAYRVELGRGGGAACGRRRCSGCRCWAWVGGWPVAARSPGGRR